MKIERPILALTLLCLLFALVGWTAGRATSPGRVQWDYKQTCNMKDLPNYGDEGWEMVAATSSGPVTCVFFKRQK
jgi:hypothetical protein